MFAFLSKYMLLSLSRLYSVLETKPNCIGEPLDPKQFSDKGDVGFIRDMCVDKVARNMFNSLGFPVSQSCKELADMRTSTGSIKCLKWKRSSNCNKKATNEIIDKAEVLMEDLLDLVSRNQPQNKEIGEFVYGCTNDAEHQLIDSGAVGEDSRIGALLEDLKVYLCKQCAVSDSMDMKSAIHQFTSNFETYTKMKIINTCIEDTVAPATITGLFRMIFDYDNGTTQTGSLIIKIPSLGPSYNTKWKQSNVYKREAEFYASILPALYEIGNCEPFAPRLFEVTQKYVLVLEDLSNAGYTSIPRLESLDLGHSRIFLYVLARYHAFGHVYIQNLDEDNSIKELIGSHQRTIRSAISKNEFDNLCKMVKPLLSEALFQKILMAEDKILAELPVRNGNDPNNINVIMHGDLHRKNFLFKYDSDGNVSGVRLIDWQICTIGSPALDLIEFFVQNLHEEFFEANEDYLLDFYTFAFNHNLSSVRVNHKYDRLELNRDMAVFKYYYYQVLSATILYWGAKQSSENYELIATNIAKWIVYFEKKEYI